MNMFQMTGSRNQVMAYTHVRKLLYGQQVISLDDARDGVSALVAITSCCLSVSSQSRREIQILLDQCLLCKRSRETNPGKLLLIKNNCNWPLKYQKRDISHTISSCPKVQLRKRTFFEGNVSYNRQVMSYFYIWCSLVNLQTPIVDIFLEFVEEETIKNVSVSHCKFPTYEVCVSHSKSTLKSIITKGKVNS